MTTPVERVADVLQRHYRRLPKPLVVGGIKIDVSDAFLGKGTATDLIVVGDTTQYVPKRWLQTIEGVGRALDMMESRRPLTFVLVGPRPDTSEIRSMSRFARVLPIGERIDDANIRNWLAILLPLDIPNPVDSYSAANLRLGFNSDEDPLTLTLLANVDAGPDAVAAAFHAALGEPFAIPDSDADLGFEL